MAKLVIMTIQEAQKFEIELPEKCKVSDDGKGLIDIKVGSKNIGWFHLLSRTIAFDPEELSVITSQGTTLEGR